MRRWPVIASPSWRSARCRALRPMSMPRRAQRTERLAEIAWPFPRDGWPAGSAFRCGAAACGGEVEVYVRPKIGFCNCDRGVADDDEVDRVADLDLMSERFAPLAPGDVVRIADMPGRIRAYDLKMSDGSRHAAIGIAVSRRCDLLVAVAQGKGDAPELRRAALDFLATQRNDALDDGRDGRALKTSPSCPGRSRERVFALDVPGIHGFLSDRTLR